jgi:hypothetical protein
MMIFIKSHLKYQKNHANKKVDDNNEILYKKNIHAFKTSLAK